MKTNTNTGANEMKTTDTETANHAYRTALVAHIAAPTAAGFYAVHVAADACLAAHDAAPHTARLPRGIERFCTPTTYGLTAQAYEAAIAKLAEAKAAFDSI